jgi:hypothetical protein
MLYRIVAVLGALSFVAYRVNLWLAIRRAHRRGDRAREEELRAHGFRLYRFALLGCGLVIVVLVLLVWSNSR